MWNNLIFFQTSNSSSVLTSSLFVFEIVELEEKFSFQATFSIHRLLKQIIILNKIIIR